MMLSYFTRSRPLLNRTIPQWQRCFSQTTTRYSSDPLRILFCGSDDFSCASLKAVHEEYARNKKLIESLDVMVLPPKRMGRGFKTLREVPCKLLAEDLGLKIHQRETFTKWDLPEGTNLVIAVSFGLFVPLRILKSAKYGGLNVHPSLLPDLRGPAPVHHAILKGYEYTGVSLQTLDDREFDHGTVLSQTSRPGISVPPGSTVQELTNLLAPIGAQMLVQGLRDGVHVPPRQDKSWKGEELNEERLSHAPKVTKANGHVKWTTWTADEIVRRVRVLGSVWTHAVNKKGETKRLIFQDAECVSLEDVRADGTEVQFIEGSELGVFKTLVSDRGNGSCAVRASDNNVIRVKRIKEEGKAERDAMTVLKGYITNEQ
ncbi:formyl transferase [Fusarium tricinctum]|uniref:methionyl-tRNA formyltransferase n=1 Tax=Fusarium tricinctum TaxID=61284 RepID=A0A8K0SB77_9HYPO|nr:formyl transferase [Fusarium tricinctum]